MTQRRKIPMMCSDSRFLCGAGIDHGNGKADWSQPESFGLCLVWLSSRP